MLEDCVFCHAEMQVAITAIIVEFAHEVGAGVLRGGASGCKSCTDSAGWGRCCAYRRMQLIRSRKKQCVMLLIDQLRTKGRS